jgi:hypothetical protein
VFETCRTHIQVVGHENVIEEPRLSPGDMRNDVGICLGVCEPDVPQRERGVCSKSARNRPLPSLAIRRGHWSAGELGPVLLLGPHAKRDRSSTGLEAIGLVEITRNDERCRQSADQGGHCIEGLDFGPAVASCVWRMHDDDVDQRAGNRRRRQGHELGQREPHGCRTHAKLCARCDRAPILLSLSVRRLAEMPPGQLFIARSQGKLKLSSLVRRDLLKADDVGVRARDLLCDRGKTAFAGPRDVPR